MKINRLLTPTSCFVLLAVCIAQTASSTETDNDLKHLNIEHQRTNETKDRPNGEHSTNEPEPSATSGRSLEADGAPKSVTTARGGRMLDLDRLVGDIGKADKEGPIRQRQSRILNEDIAISPKGANNKLEGRSKGKAKKKMAISGFIPIVSLDSAKEGKHYENPLEPHHEDEEDEESDQQNQQSASNTKEQLMSSYGGQTSIGHASFSPQLGHNNQMQSQWQATPLQDQFQEAARANRKLGLPNNLLGSFSNPKRLVSTLVQPQLIQNQLIARPQLQAPINSLQMGAQQQADDCICVPFFQCRNGYLSESQLSKSQWQQIAGLNNPAVPAFNGAPNYMHQVPRSLAAQGEPSAEVYQTGNPMGSQMGYQQQAPKAPLQSSEQQQIVNDIYEQLRKNIDADQLMQQLKNEPPAYQQLDERSKAGGQQEAAQNGTGSEADLLGRSFLNPLGRRSSGQSQRCGIMRTCCRIPPSLQHQSVINQQAHRDPQFQRGLPPRPPSEWYPSNQQLLRPVSRPQAHTLVQQTGEPQIDYQQASSALASSLMPSQSPMGGQYQLEQPQRPPVGSFMAGRCGTRQTMGITGRVQNVQPAPGSESSAEFGEFPAHAAILKRISPGDSLFVCSAALVSNLWLATAAHCVRRQRPEELKVRLGEWDVNRDDEFYPYFESNIREIVIHPDFQASSLVNDLALLRLETAIDAQQMPHIAPACLATPDESFVQQRCWLAGWGKDAFGQQGAFQSVLRKVDLPVVGRQDCEAALRYQTKLGKFFRLHSSALCAGGERGKDACEGDGGAGLYCTEPESGLTKLAGLVSWGVGCGLKGVPGVYTNMGQFYGWLESVVAASGEESLYLDRNGVPDGQFKNLVSERSNANSTLAGEPTNRPQLGLEPAGNRSAPQQADEGLGSRAG